MKLKIYGKHAVLAALQNKKRIKYKLFVTRLALPTLEKEILKGDIRPIIISNEELERMSPDTSHQGMLLEANTVFVDFREIEKAVLASQKCHLLILDQVTDPQNVGSIIRSSHAFGIDAVILPRDNSCVETPALIKASSGMVERVKIATVTNLANHIKALQKSGFWIVGLDASGADSIRGFKFPEKCALVVGSEGDGLRRLTKEMCDYLVNIPIDSASESLNVAVASAIAMYEACGARAPL